MRTLMAAALGAAFFIADPLAVAQAVKPLPTRCPPGYHRSVAEVCMPTHHKRGGHHQHPRAAEPNAA
jgi:hypothetical protein